jgi:hypothetical protein
MTGAPRSGFSAQHFGHDVGGYRVKPREWLIEDQQFRTVHQRCGG